MRISLKIIFNSFLAKLISFVAINRGSLWTLNATLFNIINNIVNSNADVDKLKVLVIHFLGNC
jgi:hypothetical protein